MLLISILNIALTANMKPQTCNFPCDQIAIDIQCGATLTSPSYSRPTWMPNGSRRAEGHPSGERDNTADSSNATPAYRLDL